MLQEEQITRLKELKQLLDSGVLSEEEFASEKAKIISEAEKAPATSNVGGQGSVAGLIDGVVSYFRDNKLRIVQIILLALTVLSVCVDDDFLQYYNFFFLLPIVLAVVTIVLSWIGKSRIPKLWAIASTVISVIVALVAVFEHLGY